ncbi:MAG: MMPL family transporter [Candidatus Thermoplasmatota archaeon]|nr:MMPL family transporter [Candidatus Thermoplasmatota archaeon]
MNMKPLAQLVVRRPKTVLFIFTIITLLIGMQASNIYIESNLTEYLPQNDDTIQLWEQIDEEFKIGSTIIIYIDQTDRVYDIRDPKVLLEMDEVVCSIDKDPLDNGEDGVFSVRSLSSLIKTENAQPPIIGGLGGTGQNKIPMDENLIARYLARPTVQQMKGILYTNTYKIGVILLQLSENVDYTEILTRTQNALDNRGTSYADMTITGTLAVQQAIQKYSMQNLMVIFVIALVMISIVLFIFHRTIKGIIIAFLPPAYALALTFGTLGVIQPQLTIIAVSIVALLMGLGVDYSIHLMNRFAEEHTVEDKVKRMEKTLQSTGKAILLSTITTMIGFGSLMISSMSPMVAFGFGCAIGILFCFISAIILVPCLALILRFEKNGHMKSWKKFASFAINNKRRVIVIACFFAVMSLLMLPYVKTDVNYMDMAPEGIPEVEKLQQYSANFGSGANFNALLVETDPNGLTDPEVIEAMFALEEKIRAEGVFASSIADELKEVNEILESKTIINQLKELLGADQIIFDRIAEEGVIDSTYSKTLIVVSIPVGKGMAEIETIVNNINDIASSTVLPCNGRVSQLTGQDAVNVAINKRLGDEQTRSMIIALLLVLAALIFIFNSSLYGFLTMIPVGFVLLWEPGFLVAFGIPLSVVTISIGSIMIGIGIDYGVHITHRVREGLAEGLSKNEAVEMAIEKTGLSLVEAALTTVAGLSAIYFVNIPALQQFGLVVILMTALSCIGAALILPMFYDFKFVK